jgi:hypothetical protein
VKPFHSTDFDEPSHVRSTERPRPSTSDIAEVLARSHSRKQAAEALVVPATTLERLCREQALVSLYEALAERGTSQRGGGRRRVEKLKPVRRWSFWWRDPRYPKLDAVGVWPEREIDAMSEAEAVDVFMTKVAPKTMQKSDLSAVEVLR